MILPAGGSAQACGLGTDWTRGFGAAGAGAEVVLGDPEVGVSQRFSELRAPHRLLQRDPQPGPDQAAKTRRFKILAKLMQFLAQGRPVWPSLGTHRSGRLEPLP